MLDQLHRILVTGGAGFLGSHLCEALLAQGHEVICVDNFFTSRRQNVAHLLSDPKFELMRHDVTQPFQIEVDRIYNLACPASPVHYQYNSIKTVKTSVLGTMHVLGMARRTGARVLQASTSEVYGDPEVDPQAEDYRGNVTPTGTRACYDEGKRCAETLCFDYHRANGVDIRVVRIFNTYGPRMHPYDGRVVSNFIRQALMEEPLTLYGEGTQTRAFCYVDDLIQGLMAAMEHPSLTGPVNLGNPQSFTIRELAEQVQRLTGTASAIQHKPLPADDPIQRRPDITLAQRELDWTPRTDLAEGLERTIESFRAMDFRAFPSPTPAGDPTR